MSVRKITVLYEDEATQPVNSYGPHTLMLACVADRIGSTPWELRRHVAANPKKGDSKLRTALEQDGAWLANTGPLIVMFDNDKIRRLYALAADACKRSVLDAIGREASGSPAIVLLCQNMEDVVIACSDALKRPRPVGKPTPIERDRELQAAAAAEPAARQRVLDAVPSFKRLVDIVHTKLIEFGVPAN